MAMHRQTGAYRSLIGGRKQRGTSSEVIADIGGGYGSDRRKATATGYVTVARSAPSGGRGTCRAVHLWWTSTGSDLVVPTWMFKKKLEDGHCYFKCDEYTSSAPYRPLSRDTSHRIQCLQAKTPLKCSEQHT